MEQYFENIFQLISRIAIIVFTLALTFTCNWVFALIYLILGLLPLKLTSVLAAKIVHETNKYSGYVKDATVTIKDI